MLYAQKGSIPGKKSTVTHYDMNIENTFFMYKSKVDLCFMCIVVVNCFRIDHQNF